MGYLKNGQGLEISPSVIGKRDEKKFQTFASWSAQTWHTDISRLGSNDDDDNDNDDDKAEDKFVSVFFYPFLVADTQFYKRLCPSIRWSIVPLIRPWARFEKWENERYRSFLCMYLC